MRALPSRYQELDWTYETASIPLRQNPHVADFNDVALNFYSRLILEHRYEFVIKIGAHTGDRAFRLAKLFPNTKIYALDVTREYREEREIDGVTIAPNSVQTIKRLAKQHTGRGLLCSSATLCCYEPGHFSRLMAEAAELNLDLAICEPNTVGEGSLPHSIRRNKQTWYHPYLQTLWRLGYTMPDNGGQQPGNCIANYGDARTYIFARRPGA